LVAHAEYRSHQLNLRRLRFARSRGHAWRAAVLGTWCSRGGVASGRLPGEGRPCDTAAPNPSIGHGALDPQDLELDPQDLGLDPPPYQVDPLQISRISASILLIPLLNLIIPPNTPNSSIRMRADPCAVSAIFLPIRAVSRGELY
jgi:hypothetical protein